MDSSSDSEKSRAIGSEHQVKGAGQPNSSRRRFAKGAVVSSAVLLSLGNRSAWGQEIPENCLSMPTWNSYTPGVGFASMNPDNQEQADKLAKADAIARAGLDDTTFPGYACPVEQEPDPDPIFGDGDRMSRQRERFSN